MTVTSLLHRTALPVTRAVSRVSVESYWQTIWTRYAPCLFWTCYMNKAWGLSFESVTQKGMRLVVWTTYIRKYVSCFMNMFFVLTCFTNKIFVLYFGPVAWTRYLSCLLDLLHEQGICPVFWTYYMNKVFVLYFGPVTWTRYLSCLLDLLHEQGICPVFWTYYMNMIFALAFGSVT